MPIGIIGVAACGFSKLLIGDKTWFFFLGGIISVFFGPAQAESRSLMDRVAPKGQEAEMFGLYTFAGWSTAFLGPSLYGDVVLAARHRWGMANVMPFLIVGALILLIVEGGPSDVSSTG